jgi:hypothetical protein
VRSLPAVETATEIPVAVKSTKQVWTSFLGTLRKILHGPTDRTPRLHEMRARSKHRKQRMRAEFLRQKTKEERQRARAERQRNEESRRELVKRIRWVNRMAKTVLGLAR